jgi:hypothetical protein
VVSSEVRSMGSSWVPVPGAMFDAMSCNVRGLLTTDKVPEIFGCETGRRALHDMTGCLS